MRLTAKRTPTSLPARPMRAGVAAALVVAALAVVMELDRLTDAVPVQHLYYFPIVLASVRFGRRQGTLVALASIVLFHLADPGLRSLHYGERDVVQLVLFLAIALVTARLAEDAARMRELALTDDLTGLHNLRSFEEHLAVAIDAARAAHAPVAMLSLDVDRLKAINDTYGHLAGASAVRTVGHLVAGAVPADAVACRYGGDEFAILLPGRDAAGAARVAEDVRRAVAECAPSLAGRPFPAGALSVSIGAAHCSPAAARIEAATPAVGEALFRRADEALYRAKRLGRNRVALVAGPPPELPLANGAAAPAATGANADAAGKRAADTAAAIDAPPVTAA